MRLQTTCLFALLCATTFLAQTEARRIRVRPVVQEEEDDQIQYYNDPQDDDQGGVVYISSADQYNGLYGQQAASRSSQPNNIYRGAPQQPLKQKAKEIARAPPVQTIRNYNKVNDDGSFTFGYEAADGSFKKETRGTDCVVRGKYGYVDPDGNKREFTYVSGNPCDPNNKDNEESEEKPETSNEPENIPANYPSPRPRPRPQGGPVRPLPVSSKPSITLFQNNYEQEEEEQPAPEQVLRPQQPIRPVQQFYTRPQYIAQQPEEEPQIYQRPRLLPASISSTTPASVVYKSSVTPIPVTQRIAPTTPAVATTYRPPVIQVTPKPNSVFFTRQSSIQSVRPTLTPITATRGSLDFDSEFQRFQTDNSVASTPRPAVKQAEKPKSSQVGGQVYSSELVYDPATGQYKTQLYQTLPQTEGEFTLNQQIQPYVQPQANLVNIQQLQQQSPLYRHQLRPQASQALYQQQQQEQQFQNSAQLFAQQQRARTQQQPSNQQTSPQQFYYIQPSNQHQLPGSQIDAFLRGHNIQF